MLGCTESGEKEIKPMPIPVIPTDSDTIVKPDTLNSDTLGSDTINPDTIIRPETFTGLPIMWIETEGRQEITSKDEYLSATFRLDEGDATRSSEFIENVNIKGRGNTSWDMFDKKPYRLKFDKKVSLLGEPADKSWVLIANYIDRTMLRTYISLYMGHLSNLEWTPHAHFVELMLNGEYNGTYLLAEKIKVAENRVNIGPDGILLELDAYAPEEDSPYFTTNHFWHEVAIKSPHVEYGDDTFNLAKDLMTTAEAVLFSDNFTDPKDGWRKYLDEASFVDWYLVNEIVNNTDAIGWSSIYFACQSEKGKIMMGPLWDFDMSFGVTEEQNQSSEGFRVRMNPWIDRLFADPLFVESVKERFDFFYGQKETILSEIDSNSQYLRNAAIENENRWHTMYKDLWRNPGIMGGYENEVQFMKQWLNTRLEWLKHAYDNM